MIFWNGSITVFFRVDSAGSEGRRMVMSQFGVTAACSKEIEMILDLGSRAIIRSRRAAEAELARSSAARSC